MSRSDAPSWRPAIDKEIACLQKNNTKIIVAQPVSENDLTERWRFTVKEDFNKDGHNISGAKKRFVARDFKRVRGVEYNETFAPGGKLTSIRVLLSLVAHFNLELHQMDVVAAFQIGY